MCLTATKPGVKPKNGSNLFRAPEDTHGYKLESIP
jgi:hypothetical protein